MRLGAFGLTGCSGSGSSSSGAVSLSFDDKAWHYDATNDVYWQLGKYYVSTPAAKDYETLGGLVIDRLSDSFKPSR